MDKINHDSVTTTLFHGGEGGSKSGKFSHAIVDTVNRCSEREKYKLRFQNFKIVPEENAFSRGPSMNARAFIFVLIPPLFPACKGNSAYDIAT